MIYLKTLYALFTHYSFISFSTLVTAVTDVTLRTFQTCSSNRTLSTLNERRKQCSYPRICLARTLPLDPLAQPFRWHLYRHEFLSDPNGHRRVSQKDLFIARGKSVADAFLISTRDSLILYPISDGSLNALLANDSFGTDKTDITFVAQDSFVTLVAYGEKSHSLVNIALIDSK